MNDDINKIKKDTFDRFRYNEEAQEIKDILSLNNNTFRTIKLTRRLYYAESAA